MNEYDKAKYEKQRKDQATYGSAGGALFLIFVLVGMYFYYKKKR